MCRVLEVSRSGYYDWVDRPESMRVKRHRELTVKIRQAHIESRKIYGSPRIHGELVDQGEKVGKNTVACLMKRANIQSKVHKRFVVTTDSRNTKKPAENKLAGIFISDQPNRKWVSDVTYIPTRKGWLFLSAIMDLYSRLIVGWSMGESNNTELVEDALKMATAHRKNYQGVILHSDQGVQYASTSYQCVSGSGLDLSVFLDHLNNLTHRRVMTSKMISNCLHRITMLNMRSMDERISFRSAPSFHAYLGDALNLPLYLIIVIAPAEKRN